MGFAADASSWGFSDHEPPRLGDVSGDRRRVVALKIGFDYLGRYDAIAWDASWMIAIAPRLARASTGIWKEVGY